MNWNHVYVDHIDLILIKYAGIIRNKKWQSQEIEVFFLFKLAYERI